jgi:endoglucanase
VDAIPPLLAELVLAPGPSGSEDLVQAIVRREAAAIGADVETDVLGSTVARLRGSAGGRVLALVAHADQVGLVVRAVGEDGLLRVAAMGSWPSSAANGQRMRVLTRGGEIRGGRRGAARGRGDVGHRAPGRGRRGTGRRARSRAPR